MLLRNSTEGFANQWQLNLNKAWQWINWSSSSLCRPHCSGTGCYVRSIMLHVNHREGGFCISHAKLADYLDV